METGGVLVSSVLPLPIFYDSAAKVKDFPNVPALGSFSAAEHEANVNFSDFTGQPAGLEV